ncbi:MAG TPA: hypothetical protein VMB24_05950 [Dehalococcoidales bacterium]|nr:hypothetical protein [Dehalococcoidales bacterium]
MYDAVSIEDRGKPVVALVNYGFANDAESASRGMAMPVVRYVTTKVPCESSVMSDIEEGIDGAMEAIITAMTKPLTAEEKSPKPREKENPPRLIFKGSLAETNQFFYRRGWTDGLPIIPPTEEAVKEMLTGTDLPPDKLLGTLESRKGKVTIEKIAINAVMAGCLPTYMPVLIAGAINLIESEPGFAGFTTFGFSTGSWAPFWIINGPIRNEINVNNSSGAFSPGNIANAAIGRAMGLIIKNLGGVRKGVEDMGVMGNPLKYTAVIAENEEESPWEPLHVEMGYKKEESTVTLSFPQSYYQHWPYGSDAMSLLNSIVDNLPRGMRYNMVITPPHAKNLAREGFTKEKVKEYIVTHKLVSTARMRAQANTGLNVRTREALDNLPADDTQLVPLIKDPRFFRIIVGGGPGAFIAHLIGGGATPGKKQIQKIELPKNWAKLVAKYKNVVPVYAKY